MAILGGMGHWTLDDIPWEKFDRSKVDPEIVRIVKAASLVEQNGRDYTEYLCGVFHDDPEFQAVARRWGGEEVQHGEALGRWATLADPSFDHEAAAARFTDGFRVNVNAHAQLARQPRRRAGVALHRRDRHQFLLHRLVRGGRGAGAENRSATTSPPTSCAITNCSTRI